MNIYKTGLENRDGELYIGGVSCVELADKFDTPLYIMNKERIKENYRRILSAFEKNYKKIRVHYAVKANSNFEILRTLREEGAWIDAASPGEVFLSLKAGFKNEKILFTGTSVRNDELEFMVKNKIRINIDSLSEFQRLLNITSPSFISFRINLNIGAGFHERCITGGKNSKFGIWEEEVISAYKKAKEVGVKEFGIHTHIGSGILKITPFLNACKRLLSLAGKLSKIGIKFKFISIGGGFGVPYKPNERELNLEGLAKKLLEIFNNKCKEYGLGNPFFCIEPGRYIVCDAGILLTRVNTIKETPFKRFIGVDAGFNTLIRPAMYGAYHHILLANKLNARKNMIYDVVGPICESGDILAKERALADIKEGDILAVLNAGAYGLSMSSQFNLRPRAAELIVEKGKYQLVRKRETLEDLLQNIIF